jgi:small subunit ribosomal protein S8
MTMTDPIADFLTRIRNGQQANLKSISSPFSAMRKNIADVLMAEGYIRNVAIEIDSKGFKQLIVELKYVDGRPVIQMINRVSTPGRRVYSKINELPQVFNGLGMNILSTNKGVMSDHQARKESIGGEVLCKVF